MNLGVNTQFDFFRMFEHFAGKPDPHEVIEEHPLVRMKLSYLHQRNHLYQFQSRPVLIELILNCRSVEGLGEEEDDVLPNGRKQFGQFLCRGPEDEDANTEEDENEDGLGCFCIFCHFYDFVDEQLSLISILIFLASIQNEANPLKRLNLLFGLEGITTEKGSRQGHFFQIFIKNIMIFVVVDEEVNNLSPILKSLT
jgi:hypothetical protein